MSATPNQSNLEAAIGKVDAFCSSHSLFKSDEELGNSFESFFVSDFQSLENVPSEKHLSDLEAIKEILPVLYEVGERLLAGKSLYEVAQPGQTDPSNRLYASLKRHPE